jgi:hypothetical protein
MKEHKHAEVLRAIADGKEVEYWYKGEWRQDSSTNPITNGHLEWRIKPEPKPPIVRDENIYFSEMQGYTVTSYLDTPNVRFTFDPDTKLPIKVELI